MGEEVEHDEGLLWDDQSWAFPNLEEEEEEEDCGIKSADKITNSEAADAKGKKRSGGGGGGECEDHELHIWTERERRKKMRNMFSNLHALLPHIPPKADKSTIVEEAIKHIKRLQQSVEELEKRKVERYKTLTIQSRETFIAEQGSLASPNPLFSGPEYEPIFKTWTSPNVILNICGRDAHMNVCSVRKPGLLAALCFVLEKHHLEVVTAQASAHHATCMYMIHARHSSGDHFQQPFPIEEIFKQAAAEIMLWVSS